MNYSIPFPVLPDAKAIYQAVVACGRDEILTREAADRLIAYFGPLLPMEAGKAHAGFIGEYVGASLVGHSTHPREVFFDAMIKNWDYAWKVQSDGDTPFYRPNKNSYMYAIIEFLRYVHLHYSRINDHDFSKGMMLLTDGPLEKWIDEEVVFDFNEEGWRTSKPKMEK